MSGTGAISGSAERAKEVPPKTSPRLDALLVERGLVESRARAQALIMSGAVRVSDEVVTKAGNRVPPNADLRVEIPREGSFVSRAGEKLAYALDAFGLEVRRRDCLDAGASTGGFTDVLLKRGADRVIAVDVGYGQLDWSLRKDPRVVVMERTNVRRLSVVVALESLLSTAPSIGEAVVLVKPQFEAGPEHVARGGLVRDPAVRAAVVSDVAKTFGALGFGAVDVARSPVTGRRAGNVEYPLRLLRGVEATLSEEQVLAAVGSDP